MTCMDKTYKYLEDDFKSFSTLTQAQGQIHLILRVKKRIKALVQWTRDKVRLGRDPIITGLPVELTAIPIRRYNTHAQLIKRADSLSSAARSIPFKEEMKWAD